MLADVGIVVYWDNRTGAYFEDIGGLPNRTTKPIQGGSPKDFKRKVESAKKRLEKLASEFSLPEEIIEQKLLDIDRDEKGEPLRRKTSLVTSKEWFHNEYMPYFCEVAVKKFFEGVEDDRTDSKVILESASEATAGLIACWFSYHFYASRVRNLYKKSLPK